MLVIKWNKLKMYIVNFVYFNNIYLMKLCQIIICYKCFERMNKKHWLACLFEYYHHQHMSKNEHNERHATHLIWIILFWHQWWDISTGWWRYYKSSDTNMRNERFKIYLLPRISDKKDRGKTTLLKIYIYEYGHSTGYEAEVWSYTLCRPQTDVTVAI